MTFILRGIRICSFTTFLIINPMGLETFDSKPQRGKVKGSRIHPLSNVNLSKMYCSAVHHEDVAISQPTSTVWPAGDSRGKTLMSVGFIPKGEHFCHGKPSISCWEISQASSVTPYFSTSTYPPMTFAMLLTCVPFLYDLLQEHGSAPSFLL